MSTNVGGLQIESASSAQVACHEIAVFKPDGTFYKGSR